MSPRNASGAIYADVPKIDEAKADVWNPTDENDLARPKSPIWFRKCNKQYKKYISSMYNTQILNDYWLCMVFFVIYK